MELNGAKILYAIHTDIPLLGDFKITQTLVVSWLVMALLSGLAFWLTRDLKVDNVSKRQVVAEFLVETLDNFVHGMMGSHFDQYIPLVGTIFALSVTSNLISVLGFWSPTADLNTELAWAVVVFILITYHKLKANGLGGYLKGFTEPVAVMTPMNIVSEIAQPVSMAFRLFGNVMGGGVITSVLYAALSTASAAVLNLIAGNGLLVCLIVTGMGIAGLAVSLKKKKKLIWKLLSLVLAVVGALALLQYFGVASNIPILQIGLPAVLSLYFDLFSGFIQAFVFCLLSMVYISSACPALEEAEQ